MSQVQTAAGQEKDLTRLNSREKLVALLIASLLLQGQSPDSSHFFAEMTCHDFCHKTEKDIWVKRRDVQFALKMVS